ncbi:MAG: ferric reductase-like transmembrane domain-containing protein [Marinobacter sp.]|nr:ferric reductase-like transmembrane domain-containing protein [Marinobacter sp.]
MLNTLRYPGERLLLAIGLVILIVTVPQLWQVSSSGLQGLMTFFGRLTGVAGLVALLGAASLAVRLPGLDRWFGGLPRIWELHRALGFWGFILTLLHVALLALAAYAHHPQVMLTTLYPPVTEWPVWAGWGALLLLTLVLAPTLQFFGPPQDYQRWKTLHRLSAPMLVLALGHGMALSPFFGLWVVLGLVATGALFWRFLFSRRWARKPWEVTTVTRLADDVVELELRPLASPLRFEPGQFVYMTPQSPLLSAGNNEEHPFTLSSAPDEKNLRLGIKSLGDASEALQSIPPGARVAIEGPYGTLFERRTPTAKQLWLGGGIGITPFVSAARQGGAATADSHLFYLADRPERAYYQSILESLSAGDGGLTLTCHYFQQQGPLTTEYLEAHCPDFRAREIYICGPPAMNSHIVNLLKDNGVPTTHIHTEAFDFL